MGCFLGCFGSKKEQRRRHRQAKRVQPKDQRNNEGKVDVSQRVKIEGNSEGAALEHTICLNNVLQEIVPDPDETLDAITPNEESSRGKLDEQLSFGARRKVTFAVNVQTYENTSTEEITNDASEDEKEKDRLKSLVENDKKSFPSNHRYQNCSHSDDEYDMESGESEIEEEDDDDDDDYYFDDEDEHEHHDHERIVQQESSDSFFSLPSAVQRRGSESPMAEKEVNSPVPVEPKTNRDRGQYVHSVLNPIENLTQWKVVKMRSKPPLRPQKEKAESEKGVQLPFSVEPSFKFSTYSSSPKTDRSGSPNEDITVDTSLSNWLSSSEKTPSTKTSNFSFGTELAEGTKPQVSSSPRSHEDRPILGALTVEEIRQYSANSSPRKSPSRSPDEMPILGTVGSYWSHTGQAMDSSSDSSNYKGIPNTTSKYREDKLVNWHATPFEQRLERALIRGEPEAYSC